MKNKIKALAPFKHHVFLVMWSAALLSNIGTWMSSVGSAWLMTSLSPSPLMVSLVQSATTLPIFLFALPAGALADIFNKRQLLLISNIIMTLAATVFALLVWQKQVDATLLLLFTFIMGVGTAFMAPAWQSVVPQMVPKEDLAEAVALGGISINLSRAIGPVVAGILMTMYGPSSPFIANAFTFLFIIAALLWWKYNASLQDSKLPPERVLSAMIAGSRFALNSSALKATMWHVAGFMFFANAYWGLLPIISRNNLHGDSALFGYLMGGVGVGAVMAAFILPKLKKHLTANQLVGIGTLGTALVTAYFAVTNSNIAAILASIIFGMSWILVLSSFNVSAQQALPDWVRARGLAVFMLVFYGSMSLGAAFWGWLAGVYSIRTAMLIAAAGAIVFIVISYRKDLQQGKNLDHSPSHHWPEPIVLTTVKNEQGPVMIQIEYIVQQQHRADFFAAIAKLKPLRQQHGAYQWAVYEKTDHPGVFIEHFVEDSWLEHLRHHERVTATDKHLQDSVLAFHTGPTSPLISHLLYVPTASKS